MFSAPAFAGGKILVYSPWKDEIMQKFGEMFEKETGTKMESINISTGEIYARLKVEKARPQADVWHSVRAELLDKAKEEDLLAAYKPANARGMSCPNTLIRMNPPSPERPCIPWSLPTT
jgi:ABC-type thiamine transport system substrate-binding protein